MNKKRGKAFKCCNLLTNLEPIWSLLFSTLALLCSIYTNRTKYLSFVVKVQFSVLSWSWDPTHTVRVG